MALADSIAQAQRMGASPDIILAQIAKQNAGSSMAQSIAQAQAKGAKPADILTEITKQNSTPAAGTPPAPSDVQEASGTGNSPVPEKTGIWNSLKSIVSNAGEDLGQAFASGKAAKTVAANATQHANDIQTLSDLIAKQKTAGQDTSHAEYMLKTMLADKPSQYGGNLSTIIPAANKSNEQIIGDFGNLAAAAIAPEISPAAGGALFGLTHALSTNQGAKGALVDTAVSAVGGKIAELGFNAVAPYISRAVAAYGAPLLDKLASYVPDAAMPALKALAEKATIKTGNEVLDANASDVIGNAADKIIQPVKTAAKDAVSTVADSTKAAAQDFNKKVIETPATVAKAQAKSLQSNVDAVNPDLTGKAKVKAYGEVATGSREAVPASIFREQRLTPNQATANLGERLHTDIPLAHDGSTVPAIKLDPKNHVGNLKTLGEALDQTENHLQSALHGDPEVQYNLDKQTLGTKLNDLKANKPGDFIGDNGKIYDNVVAAGKKVISNAEDTIAGGRDARITFDAQAKAKFPSAFKNGAVDTSTPAGHAIKAVRDTINEHIYNTAPNGSDVQKLIGREADIFRAIENIKPKAAARDGKTTLQVVKQLIKDHPVLSTIGILGADKIVKSTTGFGL